MDLLQHVVDRSVIALWLGHESAETTQMYLHADMGMAEKALSHTEPLGIKPARFPLMTSWWPSWKAYDYADC
jgi:integrase/recombinase XerD